MAKQGLVTHGLVIDRPWIDKILAGQKSWEMLSTSAKRRGLIALIQKGTGTAVGVAKLVGMKGPFTVDDLRRHELKHHVPPEMYRLSGYKWNAAWVLADVRELVVPVPYKHRNGAVRWVELGQSICEQICHQLNSSELTVDCANDNCDTDQSSVGAY
jgi:hypothetical protein